MPIEFHSSFNNVKDYIGNNGLTTSLFGSTIWVSIIIVFIICVLSSIFSCHIESPIKFITYMGLSVLSIIFIHDSVLYSSIKKDSYKASTTDLMNQIEQSKKDESVRILNNYMEIPKSPILHNYSITGAGTNVANTNMQAPHKQVPVSDRDALNNKLKAII